jgi:RNA polymerase sigma-70 factor (ECF subfamily)
MPHARVTIKLVRANGFAANLRGKGATTEHTNLKMDLYKALQLLNDKERICITLQLMEGQSIDKISEISSIPQNTVKSHLARGKKKMADFLRANGYS